MALVCSQLSFNERSKALSEEERQAATATKVHVCRLATAFAVSLKFHMRVSEMMNRGGSGKKQKLRFALYDLLRIKALFTAAEARLVERHSGLFEAQKDGWTGSKPVFEVDVHKHVEAWPDTRPVFMGGDGEHAGGCAVPPMIMQFLRSALLEPLCRPWGYPERVLNLYEVHCGTATQSFQEMNQMVLFSLPLPYIQLCKETTTIDAIDDVLPLFLSSDRFAIRRCVALKADLPHLRAAKAQTKALLSQDLRSLTTFSEVLAGATAATGH